MLAGSYLTRTKAGSGNRIRYILGYMLPGKRKGNDGEGVIIVQGCASADQCFKWVKVGGNQKEGGRDGLIRKEGARELKNRGPTSPRIVT